MSEAPTSASSRAEDASPPLASTLALFAVLALLGDEASAALRYPDVGSAVLFPPYAVLTAALVVCRPREWIWYVLVGSLAHLATHWPQWNLSWVLLADVANIARALCAALLLRRVFGGPPRLKGIGALARFVAIAGLLAPAVGATIGAANVVFHGASPTYWLPWKAWFVSNALTGVTMLPALTLVFSNAARWRRWVATDPRLTEGLLLALALCVSCAAGFLSPDIGWHRALPFYAPLPVLIWAALRFGSGGASLALTAVAFAAIVAADRGTGPFPASSPDDLLTLQMFVLLTTLPVLCIAAVDGARQDSHSRAQELAGRLITAQEEERRRMARELHDDVNQQVAALSIGLSAFGGGLKEQTLELRDELARLEESAQHLSEAVRRLSHGLHPVVLEHAGLVPALKGFCRELGGDFEMTLSLPDELVPLEPATELCLYRTAQEALHNVARHARARRVRVAIDHEGRALALSVVDDGRGFDMAKARRRGGLGLVSLEERARLVGGRVTIASQPHHGTAVRIVVPVQGT